MDHDNLPEKASDDALQRIAGSRFAYGQVPAGFGLQLFLDEEGKVTGTVIVDTSKEGPPGHVHGGALASLVDEAMGAACWQNGYRVVAVNLNVSYRRAVPLQTEVTVTGKVERKDGRKLHTSGQIILPDGLVAVDVTGVFVEAPQFFGTGNPFAIHPDDD